VTLTFDPWPWAFTALRMSYVWAKSNNPWQTYWWFSTFSHSNFKDHRGTFSREFSGVCGLNFITLILGMTYSDHRCSSRLFQSSDILLHIQTQVAQSQVMLKMKPNFALFAPPPVKIRGGVGEVSYQLMKLHPLLNIQNTGRPKYIRHHAPTTANAISVDTV